MKQMGTVKVSAATLNALKQMLFSSENGIDINPMVEDLSAGLNQNKDLIAINCGLTLKGVMPEIDKTTRYDSGSTYSRYYMKYEFIGYSMILDKVTYNRISIRREKDSDTWSEEKNCDDTCSLETWLGWDTNPDKMIAEINKQSPIPTPVAEDSVAV